MTYKVNPVGGEGVVCKFVGMCVVTYWGGVNKERIRDCC